MHYKYNTDIYIYTHIHAHIHIYKHLHEVQFCDVGLTNAVIKYLLFTLFLG